MSNRSVNFLVPYIDVSQKVNGVNPGQIAWKQSKPSPHRFKKRLQKSFSRRQKQKNHAPGGGGGGGGVHWRAVHYGVENAFSTLNDFFDCVQFSIRVCVTA